MKAISTLGCCLLVAGCAAGNCGGDWYATGERDGRLGAGMQQQGEIYAAQCAGSVDQARYAAGWREGFSRRPIPLW
jgi:hypothetical protein